MTALAAIALSAAVLVLPASPRRRLDRVDRNPTRVSPAALRCTTVAALVAGAVLLPPTIILAVVIVSATAILRCRRRRRSVQSCSESRELETAIGVLVGELRVGAYPASAFSAAAAETSGSVADVCRAVSARARLGADVAAGLRGVGKTLSLQPHWDRLAVCWRLAADHGLAISVLMHAAQRDIAERQRFSGQVRSAMAGARATATILAGLPFLSVVMGQLIGARPVAFLLGGGVGGWLLVAGLTLVCGGLLWSDRITDTAAAVTPAGDDAERSDAEERRL